MSSAENTAGSDTPSCKGEVAGSGNEWSFYGGNIERSHGTVLYLGTGHGGGLHAQPLSTP